MEDEIKDTVVKTIQSAIKYPYLGKHTYKGKTYVVFFTEKSKGVVVMSEVEQNDKYKFGAYGEFDEEPFEYLEEGVCVRLQN